MIDTARTLTVRERLREKLKRAPRSIASAGYMQTLAYKKWLVEAMKAVSNSRMTEQTLAGLLHHYESLDKEVLL